MLGVGTKQGTYDFNPQINKVTCVTVYTHGKEANLQRRKFPTHNIYPPHTLTCIQKRNPKIRQFFSMSRNCKSVY